MGSEMCIRDSTSTYPLDAANDALADLAGGRISGAAVLEIDRPSGGDA